jgi:uncharacterized repeat protein (TIGR03803 family)
MLKNLLAICCLLVCGLASFAQAQNFTTVANFNLYNGLHPYAGLVQGIDGNLYGTTEDGRPHGTIFKVTLDGTLTTLHTFDLTADGSLPAGPLVQATDGNLYGTTYSGGGGNLGTVFKITLDGAFTTLHNFNGVDGASPDVALIEGADGNFYGSTTAAGAHRSGTVFEMEPTGALRTLHNFDGKDGTEPSALIQATDGNFYGTTASGGLNGIDESEWGTVFKISPQGEFTVLHNFDGTDGATPLSALVQASDGNFYGTTQVGGAYGDGTVFKISPAGVLTTLHSFSVTDGPNPYGALVQANDGNFYGNTADGNTSGGTIFKITPWGSLTVLHTFSTDRSWPYAGLVQDTSGDFYGTTDGGGARGDGSVYGLSTGLGPFLATLPKSGGSGRLVRILGTNLTGATSVTFNGTPAGFTVVSASEITTTVPVGATTGTVQVITPGGTLSSNVVFQVM